MKPGAAAGPGAHAPDPRRLNEMDLGLVRLVVDEMIAGRAVPAGLCEVGRGNKHPGRHVSAAGLAISMSDKAGQMGMGCAGQPKNG
jgi:hypothetical protein